MQNSIQDKTLGSAGSEMAGKTLNLYLHLQIKFLHFFKVFIWSWYRHALVKSSLGLGLCGLDHNNKTTNAVVVFGGKSNPTCLLHECKKNTKHTRLIHMTRKLWKTKCHGMRKAQNLIYKLHVHRQEFYNLFSTLRATICWTCTFVLVTETHLYAVSELNGGSCRGSHNSPVCFYLPFLIINLAFTIFRCKSYFSPTIIITLFYYIFNILCVQTYLKVTNKITCEIYYLIKCRMQNHDVLRLKNWNRKI